MVSPMETSSISALPGKIPATGVLLACAVLSMNEAIAAGPPPRPFIMAPILNTFQAIQTQRHQARTQLYREALEELRKNPQAADVPECSSTQTPSADLCLRRPAAPPAADVVAKAADDSTVKQAITAPKQDIKAPPAPAAVITPAAPASSTTAPTTTRRRIAILVGNNGYKMPIPALETPIADVNQIAEVLRSRFGYETRVMHDASKAQIVQAINKVAGEVKPEDSVLLLYAGHGYLMEDTKMGFWIPVDGSVKTAANWVSNTDISKLLQAIPSRQVLLISDSCFSGSLTREQKQTSAQASKPDEVLRKRAVLAFSSGDEEPVSDEGREGHSIFAWYLIRTLESVTGAAMGFEVYRTVHDGVMKEYPQEPQYGAVFSAGHMSGAEYLFNTSQ